MDSKQLDVIAESHLEAVAQTYYGDGHDQVREDMQAAYLLGQMQASARIEATLKRPRLGKEPRFRSSTRSGRTMAAYGAIRGTWQLASWHALPWPQTFRVTHAAGAALAVAMNDALLRKSQRATVWHCVAMDKKGLRVIRLPIAGTWYPQSATDDVPNAIESRLSLVRRFVRRVNTDSLRCGRGASLRCWAVVLKSL